MTTLQEDLIIATFQDRNEEGQAIEDLRLAGFLGNQIEVADHSKDQQADISVSEALRERGVPEPTADFYQDEFRSGCDLVMVHGGDRSAEVASILRRHGGRIFGDEGIDLDRPMGAAEGEKSVQLKEEKLGVVKEREEAGEVVIRKDVETEQKTLDVPVAREEVYIERRPATGESAREPVGEGEKEIRIPVSEEHVEAVKRPVVKEEIVVGKRLVTETEKISDTVRKETARVERKGDVDVKDDADKA